MQCRRLFQPCKRCNIPLVSSVSVLTLQCSMGGKHGIFTQVVMLTSGQVAYLPLPQPIPHQATHMAA